MPGSVSSLSFNFTYNRLAVGCTSGRMDILSAGADVSNKTLLDTQSGEMKAITAVMAADGKTKFCAVSRASRGAVVYKYFPFGFPKLDSQ